MPELIEARLWLLGTVIGVALIAGTLLRNWFAAAPIPNRFDPKDVSLGGEDVLLVEFTSPYCFECKEAAGVLKAASVAYGTPLAIVDAKERPDLAEKYAVRSTPLVLVVDRGGKVKRGWLHTPPSNELQEALWSVTA